MADENLTPDDVRFIINILRQGTIKWPGRSECLRNARKKVLERQTKDGRPVYKFHWQCAHCQQWYRNESEMEVDHIVEIGSFTGDWNELIRKMFARPVHKHLQALCVPCHMKKTLAYNSARSKWKRKRDVS